MSTLLALSVEYETTRDRVVEHEDADGNLTGWTCIPEPPPGEGWQPVDLSDDYKTRWRRMRLVEGEATLLLDEPPAPSDDPTGGQAA